VELGEVDEPALLGKVEEVLERAAFERAGEVDDRARRRGDRDGAVHGHVLRS
jgi:hypothetical protein